MRELQEVLAQPLTDKEMEDIYASGVDSDDSIGRAAGIAVAEAIIYLLGGNPDEYCGWVSEDILKAIAAAKEGEG